MTARQSREAMLAVAYAQRTGCAPAEAARRYGVAASTVRRGLARLGVAARPVGRPAHNAP